MADRQGSDVHSTPGQLRVFINYRRSDTRHVAGRLRDLIVARFGEKSVFVDVDSIEPGVDYVSAIDQAVGRCAVILVLVGDRWLETSEDNGLRRIDDPTDRLRLEVEAGLRNQTRVIPVLVDSASMPKARDLPAPLVPLSRHQATRLRHESFRDDANHLLDVVERVAGGTVASGDPLPPSGEHEIHRAARWLTLGALVTIVLAQLAFRSGVRDFVAASRNDMPQDDLWTSVIWLFPALPVLVTAWLVARGRHLGVALGSIAAATVWTAHSLVLVLWRQPDPAAIWPHILLLTLLVSSIMGLFVAVPEARRQVRPNRRDPALLAGLLVVTAILLRVLSNQIALHIAPPSSRPVDWTPRLDQPPFWIASLIPVLVCLPGTVLLLNKLQRQALISLALLQILYPVIARSIMFDGAAERTNTLRVVTDDTVFLLGSACILLAVLVGQRTSAPPNTNRSISESGSRDPPQRDWTA